MFPKLKVISGIVLYFNFMYLFCFGKDLYFDYIIKIVLSNSNLNKDSIEYQICSVSKNILIPLCNRALRYLRTTHLEYKNTLYVNYKAFENINNNACKTVKVKIPPQYGFSEESVDQNVLTCYARGPIDESSDMNLEDYPFYEKIVVYPYQNKELMIFEETENRNEFKLLDWKEQFQWRNQKPVSEKIFNITVPMLGNVPLNVNEKLNKFVSNKDSILMNAKFNRIQSICTLLYGRKFYSNNFIVDTDVQNFKQIVKYEYVVFPIDEIIFAATYTCFGFLINEDPPVRTEKYKLIPGLEDNEVILVIRNDDRNKLEAIELIQNVNKNYIRLMFPYNRKGKLPEE